MVCASTWCQQGLDKPADRGDVILAAGMGRSSVGGIDALWIERKTIYEAGAGGPSPGGRGARVVVQHQVLAVEGSLGLPGSRVRGMRDSDSGSD